MVSMDLGSADIRGKIPLSFCVFWFSNSDFDGKCSALVKALQASVKVLAWIKVQYLKRAGRNVFWSLKKNCYNHIEYSSARKIPKGFFGDNTDMKSCSTEDIASSVPCLWQDAMSLLNNQSLALSSVWSVCCTRAKGCWPNKPLRMPEACSFLWNWNGRGHWAIAGTFRLCCPGSQRFVIHSVK